MTKIGFITDLHINKDQQLSKGIDTWGHFVAVLSDMVTNDRPDLLVLGGDLCMMDGDEETYHRVKSLLDDHGLRYEVIPGNHDDSGMIGRVFGQVTCDEYYYSKNVSGLDLIFLDTSLGSMSDSQWSFLHDEIDSKDNNAIYIMMHHPPAYCYILHMDSQYAFKQIASWDELLKSYPQKHFYVFTGHYHNEISINTTNMSLYVTPSCFVQIDDRSLPFRPYHKVPCYRRIIIDDGQLTTTVRYLLSNYEGK